MRKALPVAGDFSPLSERMIAAGRKAPELLSMAAIVQIAGCSAKQASNALGRWERKAWVTKVGRGVWQRTKGFGGAEAGRQTAEREDRGEAPRPTPGAGAVPDAGAERRPGTLAGAMKFELSRAGKPLTKQELADILRTKYGDEEFAANSESAFRQNLSYWLAKGKLLEVGAGAQTAYKVVDHEFFGRAEN